MEVTLGTVLTFLVTVLVGAGIAIGVWRIESRRRLRRRARALEDRLRERFRHEQELVGAWVVPVTRTPLLRGPVQLDLVGYAPRDHQRARALELARAETVAESFTVQVNDYLDATAPEGRRTA